MDFTYPPEAEAFRTEFRAWLDEHLTAEEVASLRSLLCKYIRNLDVMVATDLPGMPIRPQHHHEVAEERPRAAGI